MRKSLFGVGVLIAFAAPAIAEGQSANATVTASATVEASLTASTTNQLNFGTLVMGGSSTIATDGSSALSAPGVAGMGQVHVEHNSNVGVTAVVPTVLTNASTGMTLAFSAECATASSSGGAGTPVPDCASFSFDAASPGTVQQTYVLVGGTITGDASAGIGTFDGDLVFTFSATN